MRGYNLKRYREDGPELLAKHALSRRQELGLARPDVAAAGGPSHDRVNAIEHARRDAYDRSTLTNLAQALRWTPESLGQIINGEDPTPLPGTEAPAPMPKRAGTRIDPERRPSEDALYKMMMSMGRIYGRSTIMELAARVVDDLENETDESAS